MRHSYGIDFGTCNSTVAYHDGHDVQLLNLERSSPVVRSVIYFPERSCLEPSVGQDAIDSYVQNGMRGRFLQSIKSVLPDATFESTIIHDHRYSPESLAAVILGELKRRADAVVGRDVRRVVLGRPVTFSEDPAEDALAERRLRIAASLSGFDDVAVLPEPVAAVRSYRASEGISHTVLVADLGAGTCDFAVVRSDPRAHSSTWDVLAEAGVHIGGDDFDAAIMWDKMVRHFGYGSTFESWGSRLRLPEHLFRRLCRWEMVPFIRTDAALYRSIREYERTSDRPEYLRNLRLLIDDNLGYAVFRRIESAKILLSSREEARVRFEHGDVCINEPVTRAEFERMIRKDVGCIRSCIDGVLARAAIRPTEIAAVLATGGTSLVPAVRRVLVELFGAHACRTHDTFTSVAQGLAMSGEAHIP
jgi:hypothetical chaperone protein